MIRVQEEGLHEVKLYLLRMAIIFAVAFVSACILTYMALSRIPLIELMSAILKTALPFAPVLAFAYLFGCCRKGTADRLEVRLCLAAYVIFCLMVLVHVIDFNAANLLSESAGIGIGSLNASFDLTPICMILLVVPLCMIADALAEYVQYRKTDEKK